MSTPHDSRLHAKAPRYAIGIDLGTTNSALAYVDLQSDTPRVEDFPIPQIVAPGEVEPRDVLPSSCYVPAVGEFAAGALAAPGTSDDAYVVGHFASRHGAEVPGRLIASAKSWLCHTAVDRTAALLPWHGAPDVPRISPVEASSRYLAHLRAVWDRAFPDSPLAAQDVTLTVPASFDEVARELTLEAAVRAGFGPVSLLEEPQAAFYAWMSGAGAAEPDLPIGQRVLVCDVGGGTCDFSLIEARADPAGGVRFHRIAVGDHLILGGDNMDLALAHYLEPRLTSGRLEPRRWGVLVQACRLAKETLLDAHAPERIGLTVAGGGSRLIGGALQTELTRAEAHRVLLDGFFPRVGPEARPTTTQSGFREFDLPYAADPAVTRHLAEFLARQPAGPDRVLFNGGVFAADVLRERVIDVLQAWRHQQTPQAPRLRVLPNARLDLAVARGAAHAGALRRRHGRRLTAGLARAYFIQVGQGDAASATTRVVCLAPAGLEEGHDVTLPQTFDLLIRQPVAFTLLTSATRLNDRAGDLLDADPAELTALPPVHTVLRSGDSIRANAVPVQLHAALTEIGTLDVKCVAERGKRSWRLAFDLRGGTAQLPRVAVQTADAPPVPAAPTAAPAHVSEAATEACRAQLQQAFTPPHPYLPSPGPETIVSVLEKQAGLTRDQWPLPFLRNLWESVREVPPSGRQLSPAHEARWLNLLGFTLRPGYGYPVDDWRVQQTWHAALPGTCFPDRETCRAEWWMLWRRLAGGLNGEQQRQLAQPAEALIGEGAAGPSKTRPGSQELAEAWRLLGALELLAPDRKIRLGDQLANRLERGKSDPVVTAAMCWVWGRLGARIPIAGPLNALVPPETAADWATRAMRRPPSHRAALFAVVQLVRETGDRYRDVPDETREAALAWLTKHDAPVRYRSLIREDAHLDAADEAQAFGEALPPGLHLRA